MSTYIDQVIEEFRKKFYGKDQGSLVLLEDEVKELEQFLREKLEAQELSYLRKLENAVNTSYENGRTQRTQEIVEMIKGIKTEKYERLGYSGEDLMRQRILDYLLSRLQENNQV